MKQLTGTFWRHVRLLQISYENGIFTQRKIPLYLLLAFCVEWNPQSRFDNSIMKRIFSEFVFVTQEDCVKISSDLRNNNGQENKRFQKALANTLKAQGAPPSSSEFVQAYISPDSVDFALFNGIETRVDTPISQDSPGLHLRFTSIPTLMCLVV